MFSIFSVHGQLIFWNRSSEFTENWQGVKLFGINDKAQQPFHKLKFTEPTFQKQLFSSPILSPPKPSRKVLPLPRLLVLATTCLSSCYSLLCYQLQTCLPSHLDGKLPVCSTHILFIILFACNPLVSAVSIFRGWMLPFRNHVADRWTSIQNQSTCFVVLAWSTMSVSGIDSWRPKVKLKYQ